MTWNVIEGDCVEQMRAMEEASVDAIVTDPLSPYGLEFMGKEWDRLEVARANRGTQPNRKRPPGESGESAKFQLPAPAFDLSVSSQHAMQEWHQAWATEALRVLKPGGHLLAFGGTRTYHRLACAVEDAGFEIRDSVIWLYGSGFPKSLDVSKAIDRAAGAEREVVGRKADPRYLSGATETSGAPMGSIDPRPNSVENYEAAGFVTAPATPEAQRWQGWGTALKPAHEPIVVARKPLVGTVAQNVERFGTGALNIDGCRIEPTGDYGRTAARADGTTNKGEFFSGDNGGIASGELEDYAHFAGRWPANVVLSHLPECEIALGQCSVCNGEGALEDNACYGCDGSGSDTSEHFDVCAPGCPVAELDRQSGERPGSHDQMASESANGWFGQASYDGRGFGDTGGASRFFYVAKASRAERNAGLEGFEEGEMRAYGNRGPGEYPGHDSPSGQQATVAKNVHPTVKPVELMRWLCRLVTPPGGTVLDPFAGSGTTGIACVLEDFDFIGVEREAEYVEIARARIAWWDTHKDRADEILALSARSERERQEHEAAGQLGLL